MSLFAIVFRFINISFEGQFKGQLKREPLKSANRPAHALRDTQALTSMFAQCEAQPPGRPQPFALWPCLPFLLTSLFENLSLFKQTN